MLDLYTYVFLAVLGASIFALGSVRALTASTVVLFSFLAALIATSMA